MLLGALHEPQQLLASGGLVFQPQRWEEAGLHRGEVRHARVVLQAADLRITVAYGNRQSRLRKTGSPAKVAKHFAEGCQPVENLLGNWSIHVPLPVVCRTDCSGTAIFARWKVLGKKCQDGMRGRV